MQIDSSAGTHSILVKAVDLDGNVDKSPAICTWTAYPEMEYEASQLKAILILSPPVLYPRATVLGLGVM